MIIQINNYYYAIKDGMSHHGNQNSREFSGLQGTCFSTLTLMEHAEEVAEKSQGGCLGLHPPWL
jgi:hypothetical protein